MDLFGQTFAINLPTGVEKRKSTCGGAASCLLIGIGVLVLSLQINMLFGRQEYSIMVFD
jgi:hypothetical protein